MKRYVMQKRRYIYLLFKIFTLNLLCLDIAVPDTVKIDFTADDSYSLEVAKIDVDKAEKGLQKE